MWIISLGICFLLETCNNPLLRDGPKQELDFMFIFWVNGFEWARSKCTHISKACPRFYRQARLMCPCWAVALFHFWSQSYDLRPRSSTHWKVQLSQPKYTKETKIMLPMDKYCLTSSRCGFIFTNYGYQYSRISIIFFYYIFTLIWCVK